MTKECSFDGCGYPVQAKGMCNSHYGQHYRGIELKKVSRRTDAKGPGGSLWCDSCECYLPTERFSKVSGNATGYHRKCKECRRVQRLRDKYGDISQPLFGCEICGSDRNLHVDHDHACCPGPMTCGKCFRGWLCSNCNTSLGLMKDDPERLRAAAKYLEGFR